MKDLAKFKHLKRLSFLAKDNLAKKTSNQTILHYLFIEAKSKKDRIMLLHLSKNINSSIKLLNFIFNISKNFVINSALNSTIHPIIGMISHQNISNILLYKIYRYLINLDICWNRKQHIENILNNPHLSNKNKEKIKLISLLD